MAVVDSPSPQSRVTSRQSLAADTPTHQSRSVSRASERSSGVKRTLLEQRNSLEYQIVPDGSSDEEHEDEQLTWGQRVLESHAFVYIMAVVIILNAVVIGLETDLKDFHHWHEVEFLFLCVFLAEIILKIWVEGWLFCHLHDKDFLWNVFDILVVSFAIFDFASYCFQLGTSTGGFATIFRTARLMRVMRMIRLIRVLKPLFLLGVGLIEAFKSIMWVTILMGTVLYVFAVLLVKTVGQAPHTDPHYEFLHRHFRNIPDCMITLFVLMSSPNLPVYQDEDGLLDSRPLLCIFLIMFICFGSFGMIAMLTGVINESIFTNNEVRKHEKQHEHELLRRNLGRHAADLYEKLPLDHQGCAKTADLKKISKDAAVLLDGAGIRIAHGDIVHLLELMDDDETGYIDMSEFVHAIEKIAEGVSPLAILEIQHHAALCNRKVCKQLDNMQRIELKLEDQVTKTEEEVTRILDNITSVQHQRSDHLVEKIEAQMTHVTYEVDRILQLVTGKVESQILRMSDELEQILGILSRPTAAPSPGPQVQMTIGQNSDCADKIESQMLRILEELSQIRNAVTEAETQMQSYVRRISEEVEQILRVWPLGKMEASRSLPAQPSEGDPATWAKDSARDVQILSEIRRCESAVQQSSKQTDRIATSVQTAIDRKFQDLARQRALQESSDKCVQLGLSSQLQDISASLHKILYEGSFPSQFQDLSRRDGAMERLRSDLASLMQESKSSFVRVVRQQDILNYNVDALTSKVSTLEKETGSLQAHVTCSLAELRSDIISRLSDLLSMNANPLNQAGAAKLAGEVEHMEAGRTSSRGSNN